MELKRTEGAQNVTTREKIIQASKSKNVDDSEEAVDVCITG